MKRSRIWRIGGYVFGIAFVIAGWWITALILGSPVLPTPPETVAVCARYAGDLVPYFGVSAFRVVVSLVIGTAVAVPIAMVCARSHRLDSLFAPVLYILYPIPKVVLLPILLVLLGLADAPKIALISLTVFFQVLVAMRDAVRAVPESQVLSARALGAGRWGVYRHVVIPATLPAVFTSLRISVGTAIAVLFIAETFASSSGLGYFITTAWGMVDYPRVFAGILALAVLGIVLYIIFDVLERRLTRWK